MEGIYLKISKTHFYEKWELEQLIRELEDTPFDSVASEIKDFLSVKNDGEYLLNVLDDGADIIRIKEFVEG